MKIMKVLKIMEAKLFTSAIVSAFVLFFIPALFSIPAFSQDNDFENYSFDDDQVSNQKQPYFALSVGGTASLLFMKYDDINTKPLHNGKFWQDYLDEDFSGPMLTFGFNFFTAMSPLVNNARLGVSYQGGSKELEKQINLGIIQIPKPPVEPSNSMLNTYRKLSVQAIGIHLDYAFVPVKSLAILGGAGFKFGSMTLEQFFTILPESWNAVPQPDGSENYINFNQQSKYRYFSLEPEISVEYALTGFLMLKVGGSYVLAMDNPLVKNAWTINGNNVYNDVPKSVKPRGFSVNLGIYLGLFNY